MQVGQCSRAGWCWVAAVESAVAVRATTLPPKHIHHRTTTTNLCLNATQTARMPLR